MFLKNPATALQEERELFGQWSELEWGKEISEFDCDCEQEKQLKVNRLDEFCAARISSDEVAAIMPMESSSCLCSSSADVVYYSRFVSPSTASQARLQEATVAEPQYARTQRSGRVMKPLRKKVMDLF